MKIAVIGANGQLGADLMEQLSQKHEVRGMNHADIEITDIDQTRAALSSLKPQVVINTAAYHVVPQCEQAPDKAFQINGTGTLNLARVCNDIGARFLHYSTDYVFDGKKETPYVEDDYCNPLNVYAATKLSGEHFALNYCDQSYVVRVSGIYGKVPCRAKGGNFITTMLRLAKEKPEVRVVNDEVLTPTPTYEIAQPTGRGSIALLRRTWSGSKLKNVNNDFRYRFLPCCIPHRCKSQRVHRPSRYRCRNRTCSGPAARLPGKMRNRKCRYKRPVPQLKPA